METQHVCDHKMQFQSVLSCVCNMNPIVLLCMSGVSLVRNLCVYVSCNIGLVLQCVFWYVCVFVLVCLYVSDSCPVCMWVYMFLLLCVCVCSVGSGYVDAECPLLEGLQACRAVFLSSAALGSGAWWVLTPGRAITNLSSPPGTTHSHCALHRWQAGSFLSCFETGSIH